MDWPILSLVTYLPLVGAALILVTRGDEHAVEHNAKYIALWTSVIVFLVSLTLWVNFDFNEPGYQFEEQGDWIEIGRAHV